MLANLLNDIRYSLHGFALRPMFAAVVVLTLALGIGVNVAVFSLYDQIMLRELPVNRPDELVKWLVPGRGSGISSVISKARTTNRSAIRCSATSRLRRSRTWISQRAGCPRCRSAMTESTVRGLAVLVSGGYFSALGVGPAARARARRARRGRFAAGERHVVVRLLDDGVRRRPGRDRQDAPGQRPAARDRRHRATRLPRHDTGREPEGVRADHARMVQDADVSASILEDRLFAYFYIFGRLRPGASLDEAQARSNATFRAIVTDVEAPAAAARAPTAI